MARIGYSYWGFLHPGAPNGSDGGKYIRWQLFNRLIERGHEIICLQRQRDHVEGHRKIPLFSKENRHLFEGEPHFQRICDKVIWEETLYPPVDFVILENRWQQFQNQADYLRQNELLEHYGEVGTPCILWDQDHEVRKPYEERFPHAIIVEPSENPLYFTKKRYTWHYTADVEHVQVRPEIDTLFAYVGNNYNRDKQFEKYVGQVAKAFPGQFHVYGNWLKKPKKNWHALHPDESPVTFHPQVPQSEIFNIYNKAACTIMITKNTYAKAGLVAIRLMEAMHAGTIVLGPKENYGIQNFVLEENLVGSTEATIKRIKQIQNLFYEERREMAERQLQKIKHLNTYNAVQRLNEILLQATGTDFAL